MERCTYRSKPLEFRSILHNNGVHCYKQIDLNFAKESSKAREKFFFFALDTINKIATSIFNH